MRYVQWHDYLDIASDSMVSEETRAKVQEECIAKKVGLHSYELAESYDTGWGQLEFAFLSLRKAHPDLTREQLTALPLDHVATMATLAATISQVYEPSEAGDAKKKQAAELIQKLKAMGILI